MSEPEEERPAQCICRHRTHLSFGQEQQVRVLVRQCPVHGKPNHLKSIPKNPETEE